MPLSPLLARDYEVVTASSSLASTTLRRGFNVESTVVVRNSGAAANVTQLQLEYLIVGNSPPDIRMPWRLDAGDTIQTNNLRTFSSPGATNATVTVTSVLVPPESLPLGTYALRVVIDPNNLRPDDNSANNSAFITNFEVVATPDLAFHGGANRIQIGGNNNVIDSGDTFTVSAFYQNSGERTDIPGFAIDYYLVPETALSASGWAFDTASSRFLGRRNAPALSAAQQINPGFAFDTESFVLPADLTELTYRLGAVLDPVNSVLEKVMVNQVELFNNRETSEPAEAITVRYILDRPDYRVRSPLGPGVTSVAAGEIAPFSGRVQNDSAFPTTDVTTLRHYLNRYPSGSRTSLGTTLIPGLAANQTWEFSVNLRVPADLFPSEYFYSCEADDAGIIPERLEANNSLANLQERLMVTAPQRPDLAATGSGAFTPTTRQAGQSITIEVGLANQGFSASGPFDIAFFLSTDAVAANADDVPLGSARLAAGLGMGATATFSHSLTLPAATTLPPGTYRLGWRVDSGDAVVETEETNNTSLLATPLLTVAPTTATLPDLMPDTVGAVPATVLFAEPVTFVTTVSNKGTGPAATSQYQIRLSLDDIAGNADDLLVHSGNRPAIAAGATGSHSVTAKVPGPNVPVGTYQIVVRADSAQALAESSETNNDLVFATRTLRLRPENDTDLPKLALGSAGASPATVLPGGTVATVATVENTGTTTAGGVEVHLVLSNDSVIGDADDQLLRAFPAFLLAPRTSTTLEATLRLPATLAPGTYVLGWHLDPRRRALEVVPGAAIATRTLMVRPPLFSARLVERGSTEDIVALVDTLLDGTYLVERKDSLATGTWSPTATQSGNPDRELLFRVPRSPAPAARYFRGVKK